MSADENNATGVPGAVSNPTPRQALWRNNQWIAVCEILIILLIFVADWRHLIPYSKTPFLFAMGWISLRLRGMRWKDIGLARFRNWKTTWLLGLAAGVGGSLMELFVTQPLLMKIFHQPPDLDDFTPLIGNAGLLALLIALSWVQAGLMEEGVYRGYVMNRVADLGKGSRWAWVASLILVSMLFGFAHTYQGITGVLEASFAGLIMGAFYLACGRNLAVPIIAHAFGDTIDFVLIFLGKYPTM